MYKDLAYFLLRTQMHRLLVKMEEIGISEDEFYLKGNWDKSLKR